MVFHQKGGVTTLGMDRLTARFGEALVYAAELHKNQVRKGTTIPYVAHLLSVAGIVIEYGGTEDEAIAALLHDAVEDQGGAPTADAIRSHFGEAVLDIVMGCSDSEGEPKPLWNERKEAYLAHIGPASGSVRLVSAADKVHNARSILMDYRTEGEALWSRFNGGKEGTLWYYRSLVPIFQSAGPVSLGDELDRVVTELERLCGAFSSVPPGT